MSYLARSGEWLERDVQPKMCARLNGLISANERRLPAGGVLIYEADECKSIYLVQKGWVSLSKSLPEGQTQIIDFGLPCDFFDLTSADGRTAVFSLEAVTGTVVAAVPVEEWSALTRDRPEMGQLVRKQAAAIRSRIAERMLRLGRGSAEERLAYAFLELGVRSGKLSHDRIQCFHLPLTQKQLGDFVGLTPVHVCRTLRRMVRQGLISVSGHINIGVLDPVAFIDMAGISISSLEQEIMPAL
jgi:CRP-like cAMP-binding protein